MPDGSYLLSTKPGILAFDTISEGSPGLVDEEHQGQIRISYTSHLSVT